MAIVKRLNRASGHTQVDNLTVGDDGLRLSAKGLLLVMLSNKSGWKLYLKELATRSKDGIDAHRTALNDLIDYGCVVRRQVRDERGRCVDYDYLVDDRPIPVALRQIYIDDGFEAVQKAAEGADYLAGTGIGLSNAGTGIGLSDIGKTGSGKTDAGKSNANNNKSNKKNSNKKNLKQKERVGDANLTPRQKAAKVLTYWNTYCREGKRPLTSATYIDPICARIKDGATGQDCVDVIRDRALAWLGDPEMEGNFNLTTLFRKSKFPKYLDSWHDRPAASRAVIPNAAALAAYVANPVVEDTKPEQTYRREAPTAAAFN